jgi:hypothetical protein
MELRCPLQQELGAQGWVVGRYYCVQSSLGTELLSSLLEDALR